MDVSHAAQLIRFSGWRKRGVAYFLDTGHEFICDFLRESGDVGRKRRGAARVHGRRNNLEDSLVKRLVTCANDWLAGVVSKRPGIPS